MALDGEGTALTGRQMLLSAHRHIADGPLDGLVQLSAAVDAGDGHLVLQCQIAVVADPQGGQFIGTARLPQDGFALGISGLDEVQRLALGADPLAVSVLHLQHHIQVTGLNFVDAGACRVGEPCKGSAYQHSQAQNHGHDAAQQGPFGTLAVCHRIFLLFFCVCGDETLAWGVRILTSGLRPSSERHSLWAPLIVSSETITAHGRFGVHMDVHIHSTAAEKAQGFFTNFRHFLQKSASGSKKHRRVGKFPVLRCFIWHPRPDSNWRPTA